MEGEREEREGGRERVRGGREREGERETHDYQNSTYHILTRYAAR